MKRLTRQSRLLPFVGPNCALTLAAVVIFASLPVMAQTPPAASVTRDFAIPAQPLTTAVLVFSEQADIQLTIGSDVTAGVFVGAVNGPMSIDAALDRLMEDTGLVWRYIGPRTITIERGHSSAISPTPLSSAPPRIFAEIQVEAERDARPLWADGSTDATATEGVDSLAAVTSRAASKTPQAIIDTPRSVSVLTADRLDQQGLVGTGEALREMPGVAARMVDGVSGFSFLSRGFEVTTFTFDGGGPLFHQSSFDADVFRLLDTPELAEFDHVELLRGSVGPYGGLADAGGVVNFQRKRPLDHSRLAIDLQTGSWNNHRIEVDATAPIGFDGGLRARVVGVAQDRDFFYDMTHEDRTFVYGVVEADIGSSLLVRLGGSYRDLRRPGINSIGLPRYLDGEDFNLPRSTCLCFPSNRYGSQQGEQFLTAEWQVGRDWKVTANATRRTQEVGLNAIILTTFALPDIGSVIYPSKADISSFTNQYTVDVLTSGTVVLNSLPFAVTAGADFGSSYATTTVGDQIYQPVIDLSPVEAVLYLQQPDGLGEPFGEVGVGNQRVRVRQFGPYFNLSVQPMERVTLQIGARKSFYRTDTNGGTLARFYFQNASIDAPITPTISLSYQPDDHMRLYATYGRISRVELFRNGEEGAMTSMSAALVSGDVYEAGMKWRYGLQGPLLSLAAYYQPISGLGVGRLDLVEAGYCCTYPVSVRSYGLDLELTGKIMTGWDVQAAYNWNRNKYRFEGMVLPWRSQQPEHQFKLWTDYQIPDRHGRWQIGGGVRVESARYSNGEICLDRPNITGYCFPENSQAYLHPIRFSQPLYAVADFRLSRRFNNGMEIAFNITNITNTNYYATTSAPAFGNYYGEPRAFLFSLKMVID